MPSRRLLTVAAALAMVAFAASITVPSVSLNALGEQFSLSYTARGNLGAVRTVALVIVLLVTGALADRFGKRRFLAWGMAAIAAGMAICASAGGYAGLLAAQALVGGGCGTIEALSNPLVVDLYPKASARPLNVMNGVFSLGLVIAALGTGEMLQAGRGWEGAFGIWALPALAGAALFVVGRYPPRQDDDGEPAGMGYRQPFLANPLFWVIAVAFFCAGGCEAGMTFWGANFVERELGGSARYGAWAVAVYGGFMAIGRFGSSLLLARVCPLRLMLLSAVACLLSGAGLFVAHGVGVAWVLFACGGLTVACFWPTLLAVAADVIGTRSAAFFALLAAAGISGCTVIPWGIGVLGDAFGLRAGLVLLPASMAVEIAALLVIARRMGKDQAM